MKKTLIITISIVLVLAMPITAFAGKDNPPTKEKEVIFKEAIYEVSKLPETISEGDTAVVTFTIPRSGSGWEFGELSGLTAEEPVFDKESGVYTVNALIDTSVSGLLDILFEFNMTAGKSHNEFQVLYENSIEISSDTKGSETSYSIYQDFSSDADGWFTDYLNGSIELVNGSALLSEGFLGGGPFYTFTESTSEWTGNWYTSVKVYIGPDSMLPGDDFRYAATVNGATGSPVPSFAFIVEASDTGIIFDCNAPGSVSVETIPAGWYTLKHYFYDNGGTLSVSMTITDSVGTEVFGETYNTAYLVPDEIGGNNKVHFTTLDVSGGLLIDDFQRYSD